MTSISSANGSIRNDNFNLNRPAQESYNGAEILFNKDSKIQGFKYGNKIVDVIKYNRGNPQEIEYPSAELLKSTIDLYIKIKNTIVSEVPHEQRNAISTKNRVFTVIPIRKQVLVDNVQINVKPDIGWSNYKTQVMQPCYIRNVKKFVSNNIASNNLPKATDNAKLYSKEPMQSPAQQFTGNELGDVGASKTHTEKQEIEAQAQPSVQAEDLYDDLEYEKSENTPSLSSEEREIKAPGQSFDDEHAYLNSEDAQKTLEVPTEYIGQQSLDDEHAYLNSEDAQKTLEVPTEYMGQQSLDGEHEYLNSEDAQKTLEVPKRRYPEQQSLDGEHEYLNSEDAQKTLEAPERSLDDEYLSSEDVQRAIVARGSPENQDIESEVSIPEAFYHELESLDGSEIDEDKPKIPFKEKEIELPTKAPSKGFFGKAKGLGLALLGATKGLASKVKDKFVKKNEQTSEETELKKPLTEDKKDEIKDNKDGKKSYRFFDKSTPLPPLPITEDKKDELKDNKDGETPSKSFDRSTHLPPSPPTRTSSLETESKAEEEKEKPKGILDKTKGLGLALLGTTKGLASNVKDKFVKFKDELKDNTKTSEETELTKPLTEDKKDELKDNKDEETPSKSFDRSTLPPPAPTRTSSLETESKAEEEKEKPKGFFGKAKGLGLALLGTTKGLASNVKDKFVKKDELKDNTKTSEETELKKPLTEDKKDELKDNKDEETPSKSFDRSTLPPLAPPKTPSLETEAKTKEEKEKPKGFFGKVKGFGATLFGKTKNLAGTGWSKTKELAGNVKDKLAKKDKKDEPKDNSDPLKRNDETIVPPMPNRPHSAVPPVPRPRSAAPPATRPRSAAPPAPHHSTDVDNERYTLSDIDDGMM